MSWMKEVIIVSDHKNAQRPTSSSELVYLINKNRILFFLIFALVSRNSFHSRHDLYGIV